MNQHIIEQQEWNNPDNWSRKAWLGLYFSKRDPRLFVRKPVPALGWTLNFARPGAAVLFLGIVMVALLATVIAPLLARV